MLFKLQVETVSCMVFEPTYYQHNVSNNTYINKLPSIKYQLACVHFLLVPSEASPFLIITSFLPPWQLVSLLLNLTSSLPFPLTPSYLYLLVIHISFFLIFTSFLPLSPYLLTSFFPYLLVIHISFLSLPPSYLNLLVTHISFYFTLTFLPLSPCFLPILVSSLFLPPYLLLTLPPHTFFSYLLTFTSLLFISPFFLSLPPCYRYLLLYLLLTFISLPGVSHFHQSSCRNYITFQSGSDMTQQKL